MSSSPIRVGFVGLSTKGWASIALAPSLLQPALLDTYKLIAVSTTSKESAAATAARYGEQLGHPVKAYDGDTSNIANDPEVDLVVVSVKTPFHKSVMLPIIAANKSFFLEWPAGADLQETREIADAAHRHGVRSIIGLQGRQSPVVRKVKELVESGKIGEIRSSSIIALVPQEAKLWGPRISEAAAYAAEKENGATMLSIAVGHQLDIVTYILGDFHTVSATATQIYPVATLVDKDGIPTGKTVNSTGSDHIAFTGLLKSGALSSIIWRSGYISTKGRRQLLWEIDGEKGSIRLESDITTGAFINIRDPALYVNGDLVDVQGAGGPAGNLTSAWVEFAKGTEGRYATIDDAVRNHRLLDAIERSAEEGRTITLD